LPVAFFIHAFFHTSTYGQGYDARPKKIFFHVSPPLIQGVDAACAPFIINP
jgi:hypothetical protein